MLPGERMYPAATEKQFFPQTSKDGMIHDLDADRMRKKVVLVFFIGGVTYAEVAAVRFINR